MEIKPRLIIGLGNPDAKYKDTYHNVGFLAIDYLAKNPPISNFPAFAKPACRTGRASAARQFPISKLIKSDVFMNQSGDFVKYAVKKYKIKPEELMIVHDDSDIELGKYKISFARNSAGHRGAQSIIDSLGTKNFWRLRIGIKRETRDKRQETRIKAGDLVLKKISKDNLEILLAVFENLYKQMQGVML